MPFDESNLIPHEQNDSGMVEMVIVPAKVRGSHQVVVRFMEPRLWIGLDPNNAVQIAKTLIDAAVQAGTTVALQLPRRQITKETRDRLVVRATNVFRNLQERGKPPAFIAREVVDSVLSAID